MTDDQAARGAAFLAMHQPGAGFVLPNAWDAGTARVLEQAGFPAIATTSAGIAFSRGVPDGGLDRSAMLERIAEIAAAVSCIVSADLEAGYGRTPADVATTIAAVVDAGVVGANLEDADPEHPSTLFPAEEAAERIVAARDAAPRGTFVLNARTDTYLVGHDDPFAEAVARAERYMAAGADCIFVPGVADGPLHGRSCGLADPSHPVRGNAAIPEPCRRPLEP